MERENRKWMYNKNNPGRRGLRDEFVQGVGTFIAQAKTLPEFLREGTIRCPCVKCKCVSFLTPAVVKTHLYKKGFLANYYVWIVHGETNVSDADVNFQEFFGSESSQYVENDVQNSRINKMVRDAFGIHSDKPSQPNVEQSPNDEAKEFYEQLEEASRPFYEGSMHSKLSVAVRLLCIKSDYNISQAGMNSIIGLMNELNPNNLELPSDYYDTKKLTSKLGLSSERIDCCEKGCMLFYKDDAKRQNCKFCGQARFKETKNGGKNKKVPIKAMHYLPLIPRLKRLYASMSSAPHMRWHTEHTKKPGILRHPSDGEAWKHFDRVYPEFSIPHT